MGDVIPFRRPKPAEKAKAKTKTLCDSGFHKWQIEKSQRLDVKRGKLVTVYRCKHCGAVKTTAH